MANPGNRRHRACRQVALAAAAALLVACSGDDPGKQIASARALLEKNDTRAAIIQLKSALQAEPDRAEARFLLGKALLAAGDGSSAALELRKALDQRYAESEVVPELARAMYVDRQFQRLTEQFGQTKLDDPLAQADLKTTLALTYGALGRRSLAQSAVEEALVSIPDFGPARLFEARMQADTGDLDGAVAKVQRQLDRAPQDHEAWQLMGDLQMAGKRDLAAALAAYRQAIAIKPGAVQSHTSVLMLLLGAGKLDDAKEQLAQLKTALPNHPQTVFFDASIALASKDIDRARELSQQLLRAAPDNARVLQLAGAAEYEKRSFLQAEVHLARALQKAPDQDAARRLLAMTYLQLSEPGKALSTLQPLMERSDPGSQVYALAAQAHVLAGDLEQAESLYTKAAAADPGNKRVQTALAISKVMRGNADAGLASLQSLASADDSTMADLPLIGALVRKKDFAGALKAIEGLEKKTPDKPIAANLRARVLALQGDKEGARKWFTRALEIQPTFYPAASALAQMALADGQPAEAQRLLDEAIRRDPKNIQALLASARLKAGTGAPREQVVAVFTTAIQQNTGDAAPRLALINYHLANQEPKAALEAAQQADLAIRDNADLVDALGRAQALNGESQQATTTFNRLAKLMPGSPMPFLRLADVQWRANDRAGTQQSLKRALAAAPDNLAAQRALIDVHIAEGRPADAAAIAKDIQKQRPDQDVGYVAEGNIEAAQKRWDRAVSVYRAGLKAAPRSSELASRLHSALLAANQGAEAKQHAAAWLSAHPKDAAFRYYLGDVALAARDFPGAEQHYREVLKVQPENALAMNNVAWLMATAKRAGAVVMAEKAVQLMPNRPVIMDTLALALASEGQVPKAVEVMRKAVSLGTPNPQLRLNLAKLLVQAGDKAGAKVELQALADLGDKFPRQAEVAELQKGL